MSNQLPKPGTWTIDSVHSFTEFALAHFTVAFARGMTAGPTGTITVAEDLVSSSVTASIDVTTLTTLNQQRDAHLLSPDLLHAEKYPTIDFASRALRRTQQSAGLFKKKTEGYELDGDLTLHGVTKPVTLTLTPGGVVTDTWGKTRFGLTATGEIQRSDFGLGEFGHTALDSGGFMLPDAVRITLELEATRDEEPAAEEAAAAESAAEEPASEEAASEEPAAEEATAEEAAPGDGSEATEDKASE